MTSITDTLNQSQVSVLFPIRDCRTVAVTCGPWPNLLGELGE